MSRRLHQHRGGIVGCSPPHQQDGSATSRPLRPFAPLAHHCSNLELSCNVVRIAGMVTLRYQLCGSLDTLVLPLGPVKAELSGLAAQTKRIPLGHRASSSRRHHLWRRSCFECFFAVSGEEGYDEINLCPDGCWNHYRFSAYRRGMNEVPGAAVQLCAEANREVLTLTATISLDTMADERLRLEAALAAVLLHRDGTRSLWALGHCGREPDFHDRRGFLLDLPGLGRKAPIPDAPISPLNGADISR